MKATLYTDGGARGNPGPAGMGAVLFSETNELIDFTGSYKDFATNNQAEYEALLAGLALAQENKVSELTCYLDSELVVKQVKGEYKAKNEQIKEYVKEVRALTFGFKTIEFVHIPREKNKFADKLVNLLMDAAQKS